MAILLLNQIYWANRIYASLFQGYLPKENTKKIREKNKLGAKLVKQVVWQFGDALKEQNDETRDKNEIDRDKPKYRLAEVYFMY